jgi:hypothetical protein
MVLPGAPADRRLRPALGQLVGRYLLGPRERRRQQRRGGAREELAIEQLGAPPWVAQREARFCAGERRVTRDLARVAPTMRALTAAVVRAKTAGSTYSSTFPATYVSAASATGMVCARLFVGVRSEQVVSAFDLRQSAEGLRTSL